MNPIVRSIAAVLAGIVVGSVVNMGIVTIGPMLIPPPAGADMSTMEGLRDSMQLFTPINFLPPFLAHALGTLVGAFVAAKIALRHRIKLAMVVGVFFLIGGIAAVRMLGGPMWFQVADLVLAYLPMAYLGAVLAGATKPASS